VFTLPPSVSSLYHFGIQNQSDSIIARHAFNSTRELFNPNNQTLGDNHQVGCLFSALALPPRCSLCTHVIQSDAAYVHLRPEKECSKWRNRSILMFAGDDDDLFFCTRCWGRVKPRGRNAATMSCTDKCLQLPSLITLATFGGRTQLLKSHRNSWF